MKNFYYEGRSFAELTAPQINGSDYSIGEETIITYTEYDTKGNTSKETDALGTAIHYTYDEEGKLASTDIAGDGADITVTYSVQEDGGELIRVKDANENIKEEYLNAAGLTVQTADLDGDSEENTGIVTSYEYDTLGRKTAQRGYYIECCRGYQEPRNTPRGTHNCKNKEGWYSHYFGN